MIANFGGPAGGEAPGKVLRPNNRNSTWPVETEGNSFLEVVLGKMQQKITNKTYGRCHIWKVFRRFLVIRSVDPCGSAI